MTKHTFPQVPESGQAVRASSDNTGGHTRGVDSPAASTITVLDNWPERVPVTVAELEVIEIWLRSLLDEVLGGGDA